MNFKKSRPWISYIIFMHSSSDLKKKSHVLFCSVLQNRTENYCSRTFVLCSFIPGLNRDRHTKSMYQFVPRLNSEDSGSWRTLKRLEFFKKSDTVQKKFYMGQFWNRVFTSKGNADYAHSELDTLRNYRNKLTCCLHSTLLFRLKSIFGDITVSISIELVSAVRTNEWPE